MPETTSVFQVGDRVEALIRHHSIPFYYATTVLHINHNYKYPYGVEDEESPGGLYYCSAEELESRS